MYINAIHLILCIITLILSPQNLQAFFAQQKPSKISIEKAILINDLKSIEALIPTLIDNKKCIDENIKKAALQNLNNCEKIHNNRINIMIKNTILGCLGGLISADFSKSFIKSVGSWAKNTQPKQFITNESTNIIIMTINRMFDSSPNTEILIMGLSATFFAYATYCTLQKFHHAYQSLHRLDNAQRIKDCIEQKD